MADQSQILTDKSIARLPFAGEKQYKVRDSELPGFFVLIGKRCKSFMAQSECWRDGIRDFTAQVKLGDFGDMTTCEACSKAKEALGAITEDWDGSKRYQWLAEGASGNGEPAAPGISSLDAPQRVTTNGP